MNLLFIFIEMRVSEGPRHSLPFHFQQQVSKKVVLGWDKDGQNQMIQNFTLNDDVHGTRTCLELILALRCMIC